LSGHIGFDEPASGDSASASLVFGDFEVGAADGLYWNSERRHGVTYRADKVLRRRVALMTCRRRRGSQSVRERFA
jgi:hypothetical protein